MNEQLQQSLAVILNKATAGVEAGISFLGGQLPEVIEQLLIWKLAVACVSASLALILVAFAAYNLYRFNNPKLEAPEVDGPGRYQPARYVETFWHRRDGYTKDVADIVTIVSGILLLPALAVLAVHASTALQIWLAPKIYLIEYAASLAKGS